MCTRVQVPNAIEEDNNKNFRGERTQGYAEVVVYGILYNCADRTFTVICRLLEELSEANMNAIFVLAVLCLVLQLPWATPVSSRLVPQSCMYVHTNDHACIIVSQANAPTQ